jgi:hypothetical protein
MGLAPHNSTAGRYFTSKFSTTGGSTMYQENADGVRDWEACRADWEEGQAHTVDDYLWYCPWDEGRLQKMRELLCFEAPPALRTGNLLDLSRLAWLLDGHLENGGN